MKYYVYSYRQFSECDVNTFDTKEQALEYVSKQDPEDGEDGVRSSMGKRLSIALKGLLMRMSNENPLRDCNL